MLLGLATTAVAKEVRVGLWHGPVTRDGPGLLLRDLQRSDADLASFAASLRLSDADIIVLTQIDYDARGAALSVFANMIDGGHAHVLALRSNAGQPTNTDIDADGRYGEPEDAQAFGRFPGQGALAVLSRYPITTAGTRTFNDLLWRDLPGTHMRSDDTAQDIQRLSSGGHWVVPVEMEDDGASYHLSLLIGHAGAPVFDGPEDRNGRRNLDELRLWEQILSGMHGPTPNLPWVFMANTNLDPARGDGQREAMAEFLARDWFNDPLSGEITAFWDDPGPMRVSYVLPSSDLSIRAARVWPVLPDQQHSLITMDLVLPDAPLP